MALSDAYASGRPGAAVLLSGIAIDPRDYQQRVVDRVVEMICGPHELPRQRLPQARAVLVESPTGSGKTVTGLLVANEQNARERGRWWLRGLRFQGAACMDQSYGKRGSEAGRLNDRASVEKDSSKHVREAKVPAERLVGKRSEATATELMNELQASDGTNSQVLFDLQVRFTGLVMNGLRKAGVRSDAIEDVFADVWDCVWETSTKPVGAKGAWNPGKARYTSDPFVPWLKRVVSSRAIDWHRRKHKQRKRQKKLQEFVERHGESWIVERGDWEDDSDSSHCPLKRRKPHSSGKNAISERRSKQLPTFTRRQVAAFRSEIADVVAKLATRLQAVLVLKAEELSNVSISEHVGCSSGEVSRRLTAARNAVMRELVAKH
jgi:RNA polymerase sigma factor (sigma-70 family)